MRPSWRSWDRHLRSLIAAAGLALVAAAGLGVPGAGAETVLRISANTPVGTLDTVKMRLGALEYNYAFLVFSRLASFDEKLNIVPDLAERWEASPDQKVWTFHLRKGVKWHHGRELDAEDVVATFARILDPANGSLIRGSAAIVEKTEAVDKHTVRFTLSIPYSGWPAVTGNFQASIQPRDRIDTITTAPSGTGPYKFVDYQPGAALNLAKNADYFEPGVPKTDKVVFRIIPDFNTAVAALQRGEIDLLWGLPPEYIDEISKSKVAHVSEVATGSWLRFGINHSMAPLDNPKVRQALVKLIDREEVAEIAMFGRATPTLTAIPPGHPFYHPSLKIPKPDIEGAKKLLAEAGYPNGLSIVIGIPSKQAVRERIAVAVRDQAKKGGINIDVQMVPEDQFRGDKFPLFISSFFGRAAPDLMLYDWYHSTGSWNRTTLHFKSEEVDKVLDAARQASGIEEQKKLYLRFQELIMEDEPAVALFVTNFAVGVSNKVKNFTASRMSIMDVRNTTVEN